MNPQSKEVPESGRQLAILSTAAPAGESVPGEVLIVPWGEVQSTSGSFTVDEESSRLVIEAFESHGCELPVDYEHQTLGGRFTSPNGQAPAAGWVKRLLARPGEGLFAKIEWTEPAVMQLAAKQYRYLSPVAVIRAADRKLVGLHSVALTNKPAIVRMRALVNADDPAPGLRRRLGLPEDCSERELLVAASERVAELEEDCVRRRCRERVDAAIAHGRLYPHRRDWAIRLGEMDEGILEDYLASCTEIVPLGRVAPPDGALPPSAVAARAEFRAHPELSAITSEEAYVADAVGAEA